MCMSLVIFDRRHLVLRARALTAAVGGRFLPTVRNSVLAVASAGCWKTRAYLHAAPAVLTIENHTVGLNAVRVSLPLVILSGGQNSAQANS